MKWEGFRFVRLKILAKSLVPERKQIAKLIRIRITAARFLNADYDSTTNLQHFHLASSKLDFLVIA